MPPPPPACCCRATCRRLFSASALQQLVERVHLVRQRRAVPHLVQLADGASHRLDRLGHRIARHLGACGPRTASPPRIARIVPIGPLRLFGAPLRDRFCALETARMSSRGFRVARAARARVELPGRDDDFLLRFDETLHAAIAAHARPPIAWLCAATNSSSNGFTSRKKMSLRASVDRRPRADVARTCVVGDEIARLHAEILEEHRVQAAGREPATSAAERHDLLFAAGRLEHEVERLRCRSRRPRAPRCATSSSAVTCLSPRGPHDAHVGRTIVQRADEVLGVARALEAVDDPPARRDTNRRPRS